MNGAATAYPVLLSPLGQDDGGGFLATVPDLPGCMSDGATPEEAYQNAQDAIGMWMQAARERGRTIPKPTPHLAAE